MVVKLGGSVVTDKSSSSAYRGDMMLGLAREMARSKLKLVVVHGGGSFGHPVARKYGLSSRSASRSAVGVSRTREAMFRLDQLVCSSMSEAGLNPYPFSPFDLLLGAGRSARPWIASLLEAGLVPLTFGDVVLDGRGFRILSGDTIAYELCKLLGPHRCVFVLYEDGVYDENREVISVLTTESIRRLKLGRATDVTGGIRLKLREAAKIAALGVPTAFVSGQRPNEFAKSLRGLRFHGTIVKGHP